MFNETVVSPQYVAEEAEKMVALWASKFRLYKKDYEHLAFTKDFATGTYKKPRLTAGASRKAVTSSSPAQQAEYWFFIDTSESVGSFLWLCGLFELDVERVRTIVQPLWRELYGKR